MEKEDKIFNRQLLFSKCANGHLHVNVDQSLLDGVPHVKGTTVVVSEILARLYVHGSIAAVVKYYGDMTEEQIKDALFFAYEFIELVCYKVQDIEK